MVAEVVVWAGVTASGGWARPGVHQLGGDGVAVCTDGTCIVMASSCSSWMVLLAPLHTMSMRAAHVVIDLNLSVLAFGGLGRWWRVVGIAADPGGRRADAMPPMLTLGLDVRDVSYTG